MCRTNNIAPRQCASGGKKGEKFPVEIDFFCRTVNAFTSYFLPFCFEADVVNTEFRQTLFMEAAAAATRNASGSKKGLMTFA